MTRTASAKAGRSVTCLAPNGVALAPRKFAEMEDPRPPPITKPYKKGISGTHSADAVPRFPFVGDDPQPIFIFAEVLGDLSNSDDVMDLVDVAVMQLKRRALMPASNSRAEVRPADQPDGRRYPTCGSMPFIFAETTPLSI
jgi:hypothetical protein